MGAVSRKVASISELEAALQETETSTQTTVIVIDTDPLIATEAGGHWWDVAVPEVSDRPQVNAAREAYVAALKAQQIG
jgi:3D-(3,5/4)-trihydroxycyclohexane-1,2-dione acylhydrolase (decyclizing)